MKAGLTFVSLLISLSVAGPAAASGGCLYDEAAGELVGSDVRAAKGAYARQALIEQTWRFETRISVEGRDYEKYGLPRLLALHEVSMHAFVDGVPFFVEAGTSAAVPEVLYGLHDPLICEFQPFVAVK